MLSGTVMHLHFGNASSELARNRGQVPVHARPEPERLDDVRAIDLQRATVVMEPYARHDADQPVGDGRRQITRQEAVLPPPPPA